MLREFFLGYLVGQSIHDDVACDETGIERAGRRKTERRRADRFDKLLSWFRPSTGGVANNQPEKRMNPWAIAFCWIVISWGFYSFWRLVAS